MTVRFSGVTKAYGDVQALRGLELELAAGELLVLVGPSGSGKSTALRVLAGLESPDAGRVYVGERDVTDVAPHRRGVAMVFQDYALYPHLSVEANLTFGMRVRRERTDHIAQRVRAVSDQLELEPLLHRFPDQLSGGQQQRVALARAMVREPAVYLMDEPLASLDTLLRLRTRAEIVALHRRLGTTTIYVTHDQSEAMTMGDRLGVMIDGQIQQVGPPQEVYDQPASLLVARFLGSPPMNLVPGGTLFGGPPGTVVGVRPEDLHLAADGEAATPVTVLAVERLGSESLVQLAGDNADPLWLRTQPRTALRVGQSVSVRADPARLHRFDAESGRRLSR